MGFLEGNGQTRFIFCRFTGGRQEEGEGRRRATRCSSFLWRPSFSMYLNRFR